MNRITQLLFLSAILLLPSTLGCSDAPKSTKQVTVGNIPPAAWTDAVIESYDKEGGGGTMRIEIFEQGTGEVVEIDDRITVHYQGWIHGRDYFFDASFTRGQPISFPVGQKRVIPGWDLGLEGLKVGTKARLHIPAELGYGAAGNGAQIPPGSKLVFDVKVVGAQ